MFEKLNVEYDLNLIESFKGKVAASYNDHFVEYQITDYDKLLSVLMEKLEFTIRQPHHTIWHRIRRGLVRFLL